MIYSIYYFYFKVELTSDSLIEQEKPDLNKNLSDFKTYQYSMKPASFMRNYNKKLQNFKLVLK